MKRFWLVPILSVLAALSSGPIAEAQKPRVIEIAVGDTMKYSVETIQAKPGESLTVRLKSTGTVPKIAMGHNFILLKPGTAALEFVNAGMEHRDNDFVDPQMKDKIIASTKLIGPGETAETTFKAPMKRDTYAYLCSFPGHFSGGMKGSLVVK
jgi:azurin